MMLWGYARLEHQPPPEFMTGLLDQFWRKMDGFGPQVHSLLNISFHSTLKRHRPRLLIACDVDSTQYLSTWCQQISGCLDHG